MPNVIDQLRAVAPNWVAIQSGQKERLDVLATPIRAGGEEARQYALVIEAISETAVTVSENPGRRLLPAWCPERHVNQDGSFCLGLDGGQGIDSTARAMLWWRKLELFIECQEVAHNTGRWPSYAQLSHGFAANLELDAEELAGRLGMLNQYQRAVRYGKGVIADAVSRLRGGGILRNGRAKCVCGYRDKFDRPLLRRKCVNTKKDGCIVLHEARRRASVEAFWETFPGAECCGTMKECPLNRNGK